MTLLYFIADDSFTNTEDWKSKESGRWEKTISHEDKPPAIPRSVPGARWFGKDYIFDAYDLEHIVRAPTVRKTSMVVEYFIHDGEGRVGFVGNHEGRWTVLPGYDNPRRDQQLAVLQGLETGDTVEVLGLRTSM